jgi:hypothetical protein
VKNNMEGGNYKESICKLSTLGMKMSVIPSKTILDESSLKITSHADP